MQNIIQNCGRNSRKVYKIINKTIGRISRSDVNYNFVFNNIGTDKSIIITGYFKEYFVNVADEIVNKLPQIKCPSSKYIGKQSILLYETNVVEVLSLIAMLQKNFCMVWILSITPLLVDLTKLKRHF